MSYSRKLLKVTFYFESKNLKATPITKRMQPDKFKEEFNNLNDCVSRLRVDIFYRAKFNSVSDDDLRYDTTWEWYRFNGQHPKAEEKLIEKAAKDKCGDYVLTAKGIWVRTGEIFKAAFWDKEHMQKVWEENSKKIKEYLDKKNYY